MKADYSPVLSDPLSVRLRLLSWIRAAQQFYDRRGTLAFWLLAAFVAVTASLVSWSKPLWFDELLGLSASLVPRVRDVTAALAIPVDINPPMYHFLARFSIQLFGYSSFAARLPALLAMLTFLFCLFAFVSRRLTRSYGVMAALLVLCTEIFPYAWEARPYAMVLCFTGLALVIYQRRIEHQSMKTLLLFTICCACLPLTHYYATLIVGAFLVGEVVRTVERKQVDWPLIAGMLVAPSTALFLVRNMIHSQKAFIAHNHSAGSLGSFILGYEMLNIPTWLICIAVVALALGVWLESLDQPEKSAVVGQGFSFPELAVAVSLLCLPFLGAILTRFTHAYLGRYFMAACAGYAILICYLAAFIHRRCAGVPLLLSIAFVAGCFLNLTLAVTHRHDLPAWANLQPILGTLGTPVVFQDAKDYVLARELNPDMSQQFFYAAEPQLALKMTGTDMDDKLMIGVAGLQPEQVSRLDEMARKSENWIVFPGVTGWLVPCLTNMGAEMQLVNLKGAAPDRSISGYRTRLPHPGSTPVRWCEEPAVR